MSHNGNKYKPELSGQGEPMQSSRARNRTVMLSPEMTGQVRALLQAPVDETAVAKSNEIVSDDSFSANELGGDVAFNTKADSAREWKKADASNKTMIHRKKDIRRGSLDPLPNFGLSAETSPEVSTNSLLTRDESRNGTLTSHRLATTEPSRAVFSDRREKIDDQVAFHEPTGEMKRPFAAVTLSDARAPQSQSAYQPNLNTARTEIIGFLITFDRKSEGEVSELRVGRWLVSSRSVDRDSEIIIQDDSISASHAVIKVGSDGVVQVLDQLSEFGTGVIKQGSSQESDAANGMIKLEHGDMLRLGMRYFVYCGVPRIQIAE